MRRHHRFRSLRHVGLMTLLLCGFALVMLCRSAAFAVAGVKDIAKPVSRTDGETFYQPDLWIGMPYDVGIGDDIYLLDEQVIEEVTHVFQPMVYQCTVQHDGNGGEDSFFIIGTAGGDGWTITYYDAVEGGTDITQQVTTTGWLVGPLADGEVYEFRVEVTPTLLASLDTPKTVQVTALSANDPAQSDTVAARTTQLVGGVECVSINDYGMQGNGHSAFAAMDMSGRYIVYESLATDLVYDDINNCQDIFLFDRVSRTVELISVASNGAQGNGDSYEAAISADGRYVVFRSHASNLAGGDTNGYADIFVRDRQQHTTTRVSVATDGTQGRLGHSYAPTISADGRYIAYHSYAQRLAANDLDNKSDIFLRDTQTGVTERISLAIPGGTQGTGDSFAPSMSADGRYIAYWSGAKNLVADDTNNFTDIFLYDRVTRQTTRVSLGENGAQANNASFSPAISGNGRYIAYDSLAINLIPNDTNNARDVFVYDRVRGITSCVSVSSSGVPGNANSESATISYDGLHVAFASAAYNLVDDDQNRVIDVFHHNRQTGATSCVSTSDDGWPADKASNGPILSANGRLIAFHSDAMTLISDEMNDKRDIYVREVSMISDPGPAYRPDLWVRNGGEQRYVGNNRYVVTEQTKSQVVATGEKATYHLLVESGGFATDTLLLTGPAGGNGWSVQYFDALTGGTNITEQVTGEGWATPALGFEEGVSIRVEVTPDASVPADVPCMMEVTATSQSDDMMTDTVKIVTSRKPISQVTLTLTPVSPVRVGTKVTLLAQAIGTTVVQYRFFAMKDGETTWTQLRPYATANTYDWTPSVAGKYTVLVWAREVGRNTTKDAYATQVFTVAPLSLTSVSLSALPQSPVLPNTVVTLLATPVGGVAPQYRFFTLRKGETAWTTIRPYAAAPTAAWCPTLVGEYTLLVWARETGSPFQKDVFATLPFTVRMDPPVITLNPLQVNEASGLGTLSGTVTGDQVDHAEITFNGFTWNVTLNPDGTFSTIIILAPGTNTIVVRASNAGGITTSTPIVYEYNPTTNMFFRVTLIWDGTGDIDLHTWSPTMQHSCYWHPTIATGHLDVDNVTKDGPENFTCTSLADGRFRVAVNSFSGGAGRKATIRVLVTKGPNAGQSFTFGPYTFTSSNGESGYPVSGNTNAWWRPCDIMVSGENITAVSPDGTSLTEYGSQPSVARDAGGKKK